MSSVDENSQRDGAPAASHAHGHGHHAGLSWWELWPMLAWGAYTLYLYATGRIFFLLQRLYGHLAAAGAVVLLVGFAYGWVVRRRRLKAEAAGEPPAGGCACGAGDERVGVGRYVRSLAFLVPLVVGLSLPARGPNSLAAVQWGAGDLAMMAQMAAQRETERAEMRRGYGWLTVIGVAQRLEAGQAEKVGALGFVARRNDTPPGRFFLVRFTMACCAACATPVAIPVKWDQEATLPKDQWVKVYGRIDPEAKVLVADDVELAREPGNPYL